MFPFDRAFFRGLAAGVILATRAELWHHESQCLGHLPERPMRLQAQVPRTQIGPFHSFNTQVTELKE